MYNDEYEDHNEYNEFGMYDDPCEDLYEDAPDDSPYEEFWPCFWIAIFGIMALCFFTYLIFI